MNPSWHWTRLSWVAVTLTLTLILITGHDCHEPLMALDTTVIGTGNPDPDPDQGLQRWYLHVDWLRLHRTKPNRVPSPNPNPSPCPNLTRP